MEESETTHKDAQGSEAASNRGEFSPGGRAAELLRRFILFICCGPGVLGFLWLIGRILRR
jgi:hypothetical protein